MKTQIVNRPNARMFCKKIQITNTARSLQWLLTVAVTMSAFLLAGSIAVHAQSPSTYSAQSDGFGFPGDPATMANGTSGAWSLAATLPLAAAYQYRETGCCGGLNFYYWSYDYSPGGSFTLLGPGYTFNGTFTSGYGYGQSEDGGPDEEALTLDMYFSGQWNGPNGPKEAGFMQLVEGGPYPDIEGTATLNFAPAPEPGSILLFGSGILGLASILRRKLMG